jgi:hypothetical protein
MSGRILTISNEARQTLIDFVCVSSKNRRMSYQQIAWELDWPVSANFIRQVLKRERFSRHIARRKFSLSEINRLRRYEWVIEHVSWSTEQWRNILWSDKTWINDSRHDRVWVTRRADEKLDSTCIVLKYNVAMNECFEVALRTQSRARACFERKIKARSINSLIASVWFSSFMNEYACILIFYSCRTMPRVMQLRSRLMSLQVEAFQQYIDSRFRLI